MAGKRSNASVFKSVKICVDINQPTALDPFILVLKRVMGAVPPCGRQVAPSRGCSLTAARKGGSEEVNFVSSWLPFVRMQKGK